MGEEQKKVLEQQLWNIANTLRGKMDADEFRDYILGFIFYKYLSEKMEDYGDELLQEDAVAYVSLGEEEIDILDNIKEDAIESLGYFLKPSELFSAVATRGNAETNNFILEDLTGILRSIEQSTMGHESEDDFEHLFEVPSLSCIYHIGDTLGTKDIGPVSQCCEIRGGIEIASVTLLYDHWDLFAFQKDTLRTVTLFEKPLFYQVLYHLRKVFIVKTLCFDILSCQLDTKLVIDIFTVPQ